MKGAFMSLTTDEYYQNSGYIYNENDYDFIKNKIINPNWRILKHEIQSSDL
jgi:hypothetical protein